MKHISEVSESLTEDERRLLVDWNNTETVYHPHDYCFHQLFEEQVQRTPEAVALVFGDSHLTYHQLNKKSNQLAHYLRSLGVAPDVLVGICIERSLEMVIGLLAILKAGGAYVPLDPSYPAERLAFMLGDTQAPVILTQQRLLHGLPTHKATSISLDTDWDMLTQECEDNPTSEVRPTNLAYIIYTSGSTGKPKGVMIPHRGLVNYLSWCTQAYAVAEGEGTLVHSPLGFDLTITSLLSPLIVGQKAILLPEGVGVEELQSALHKGNDFSLVKITPAHLKLLSQELEPEDAGRARILVIGGEALRAEDIAFWRTHAPGTRLINEYGPTETVVGCSIYEVSADTPLTGAISIGRPISNTQLYILDDHLQPVPINEIGELYIGGDGVARGYLNRPELTAERFISHPWSTEPNARLYKTGDMARYRADGNIEFLGRLDDQVKIRGFRIELGEIESLLELHSAVRKAVVITREDASGEQQLVAYVILHEKHSITGTELQQHIMGHAPSYMVPAAVKFLDAFPLTPNGKVDRRSLSTYEQEHLTDEKQNDQPKDAPRTPLEETVARIWSQALGVEHIGIHDDFFLLGGHSLLAMQVIANLRTALHVELPLLSFFEADTVAQQAEYISTLQAAENAPSLLPSIQAVPRESYRKSVSSLPRTSKEKVEKGTSERPVWRRTQGSGAELPNPREVLPEPQYALITKVFASWVRQTPDHAAIRQNVRSWTYRELADSASSLAQSLLIEGQQQGNVVAIIGQRSFGLIASMMGALLSGGVILPIDRTLPVYRQQLMLREAGTKYLLYVGDWRSEDTWIQELAGLTILRVEPEQGRVTEPKTSSTGEAIQLPTVSPEDAAYIFFTSGTTGIPKGVLGRHKGLSHFLSWERKAFEVGPKDRSAQLTFFSFDVVLRDIFLPLTSGATLCLPEWHDEPAFDQILLWLEREKITLLHTGPSLAQTWLTDVPAEVTLRTLRWVFFAGEPLTDVLVRNWRSTFPESGGIANFYGPTETTLAKCYYVVDANPVQGIQPIGRPLPETQALILNESNALCSIGEIGEIVIRTPFRSLGYINAPEENQKRFITNPFRNDESDLLYRTGDRGRYRTDGILEILGRMDHQVKIHGVGVEPDEVMATLLQHPAVKSCVVIAYNKEQDQIILVAYVVTKKQEHVTNAELRSYLSTQLPSPMIPSVFMLLESLPLTPNGKVNRKALPLPNFSGDASTFVAPTTTLQKIVAASWSQALGNEQISILDNFFALGGHSLLAMQIITRLRKVLHIELSLGNFFEAPTIAQQAELISQLQADETTPASLSSIEAVSRESLLRPASTLEDATQEVGTEEVVVLPISLQQQGLWLIDRLETNSSTYNVPILLRVHKHLDMVALEQSVHMLVQRHEALRTTFTLIEDQPMQVIAQKVHVPLKAVNLKSLSAEQQEIEVKRIVANEVHQPFDLAHGPLLRVSVLHLGNEEHLVLLLLHHIVSDGWSVGVIGKELTSLYDSYSADRPLQLLPLPLQYADFTLWQREWLQGERMEQELKYWKETLAGAPPALTLPTDFPRPTVPTHQGALQTFVLSESLSHALKQLSYQEGVTFYMTMVASFVALLQRYTGQDDVVIGTTVAGRNQQEITDLVGYFVNTLVLRTHLEGNPSVQEVLARVRETVLAAHGHQHVPFEWVVKELQPERTLNQHPLFQVMLTFDPPMPNLASNWAYAQMQTTTRSNKFDLSLGLSEQENTLQGFLEYSTELFKESTIERMMIHWQKLLEAMVANPQQPIAQLPLLTEKEQQQVLQEWNATEKDYPRDKRISQLFEEQVERTPDATALVFEHHRISYLDLNQRANRLAHALQQRGVGPEAMVGVCLERSPEMVVSLLAILKAGGVYVPLDPEAPAQRLAFQMQETQMRVLLTQESLLTRLPAHEQTQLLCLDRDAASIEQQPSTNPSSTVTGENLAYVIYTSGSTGQPKGVLIEHGTLVTHCLGMIEVFNLQANDAVLQFSISTFDVSLEQMLLPLLVGARIVVRGPEIWSASQLLKHIQEQQISIMNLPPAYWSQIAQEWRHISEEDANMCQLRLVMVGGERLLPEVLHVWRQTAFRSVQVFNAYGPTETTITATMYDTSNYTDDSARLEAVPIGHPVPNRTIYLLDEMCQPVPIGVVGELYIGGDLLARGYLDRPELTAQRFISDPFSHKAHARLYKTGDLARYQDDGTLEFVGRNDQQVKIRGFRIEVGEIEAVLSQHSAVREVAVIARQDKPTEKVLVAYVVAQPDHHLQSQQLRQYLQEKLPSYMIPAAFVMLEALPLLSNGKLNLHALPVPEYAQSIDSKSKEGPRTPIEENVAQVWSQVLGIESPDIHENFFSLGGHSLLALQMATRLKTIINIELPLRTFFEAPTIAQLAETITKLQAQKAKPQMPALGTFSRAAYRVSAPSSSRTKEG